MVKNLYW